MLQIPKIINEITSIKDTIKTILNSNSEVIQPISGWELTANNVGKTTKFGIGLTVLEVEMRANTDISLNSVAFRISENFRPKEEYMIFTYSKGNGMGSGFIYKDGRVVLNGEFPAETIIAIKVLIIN